MYKPLQDPSVMLLEAISIILAVRCKSEIATRQLLSALASERHDHYSKSLMLKILPLLTPSERDWLRSL
jgi:hypothetical protein